MQYNPAIRPGSAYDTTGPRAGQVACASKGLAAGSWVAIQNCIVAKRGRPCVAIQGSQGL